jgi:chemotaxis protein CheD
LINVGIADLQVGHENDLLRTILGSCVGICLYDKDNLVGGLSHILLPENLKDEMPKKYPDTAIPMLIKAMTEHGANPKNLIAKLVGGAQMFTFAAMSIVSKIGAENAKKVKEILGDLNIDIIAEDLGGNWSRTVDFFVKDGTIKIKSAERVDKII